jgi:hypothetical protein
MKKLLILFMVLGAGHISFAQQAPTFSLQEVKTKEDLNTMAKEAAAYILATPADTTDDMRRNAEGFLFAWMGKTEDYTFSIDYSIAKIIEENKSAGFVLLAGMADGAFKDKSQNGEQVKLYGMRRLIDYSKNSVNKLEAGPELKKIINAEQKGKLKKYLSQS